MDILKLFIAQFYEYFGAIGLTDKGMLLLWIFALLLFALYVLLRQGRKDISEIHQRLSKLEGKTSRLDTEVKAIKKDLRERPLAPPIAPPIVADSVQDELNQRAQAAFKKKTEVGRIAEGYVPPTLPVVLPEAPAATVATGLEKSRLQLFSRIRELFSAKKQIGPETYSALEELLISSDLGVHTAQKLLEELKEQVAQSGEVDEQTLRNKLKQSIYSVLEDENPPQIVPRKTVDGKPLIILMVGVNGVGKTTTIGKLAQQFKSQGAKVLLAACDTFRAAAVEQLQAWARRAGVELVSGSVDAKPSTVAYQAVHRAQDEDFDVLIIDTAGRLHTRVNLMNELASVVQIISREQPGSPQETILVLDATTGQNALQQARSFNERSELSGLVITKLDGTPKGGIVVAIKDELKVPIRYIGVGESIGDLKPFSAKEFVDGLFGEGNEETVPTSDLAGASPEKKKPRRRKKETADQ